MDSIRIGKNNIKKINVNDDGDFIELNFNDRSLLTKFFGLYDKFAKKQEELEKIADELDTKKKKGDISDSEFISGILELDKEIHSLIKDEVDNVLGENACKKIFGDIIPNIECYNSLFEALMPYFKEYADNQKKVFSKYSPDRKGGRV